ncbi:berberine bridge enzyme-like 18 [Salvia miltiorrhiza]|uniref:berberine bridge enzyme-like 18 n=1 Tax=Salvia miltiorrhiza TaxID=226208 RepID=UPI0025AC7D9B|nr:berberine bridge enzyme-like 18 [Salvia miltiorrhiza]XP_057812235.1 berberine bridge enzyme-like 18 [Salvia miltiorrhiza]
MASPHTLTFLFLIFTNLLLFGASSSIDHGYDDFLECLTDQFQRSNSATDIIYTPQNATYASLLLSQNLRPASSLLERPDLIVTPFHVSEIQAAIYCSRMLGLQIRVKSGGHDYEGLSYTSAATPFVIVDMRNFRSVTIDDKEKTARVQVGATLGQLYYTISRKSRTLAFPAGVCPTVGVGGHFSGGGYGMISRKHSIASDHIVDAILINADGKILDRRSMGEDLFWAIRGGGGTSFGIVLEFKVTLVTVPETVTVFNVTRTLEENATEIVHKWQYIADKVDENLLLRLFLNPANSPTTGNRTISASFTSLYQGRTRDVLPIMEEHFPELGLTEEDCIEMSWVESLLFFANIENQTLDVLVDRTPQGGFGSSYFKGKSDYVSAPIPVDGLREIWRFLLEDEGSSLQFSPYGGVLNTFSESETPFPHRRGNIFMIHYGVGWSNLNESQARIDWIRGLYSFMARYVTQNPRAAYFNYRDLDIGRNNQGNTSYDQASVWGLSYFKNNFRRLVRVKTKVDPSNFFRNEQSIPALAS